MINRYVYETQEKQADALAAAVAGAIKKVIKNKKLSNLENGDARVTFAVSGGKSPRLFLEKLSCQWIEWHLVDIILVDERWVSPGHPDSNYQLVRDALLQNVASNAKLHPLYNETRSIEEQVSHLNKNIKLPDVAVLGMGDDGHTASLFSDAVEWNLSMSTTDLFISVSPQTAPHLRVSLSLAALANVEHLFLQFMGSTKEQVFNNATECGNKNNAISQLIARRKKQFNVYSCLLV